MGVDNIVIIGAGIIGLDTALVLSEQGFGKHISVVAQHLPGDTSAGCNFSAISGADFNALKWDHAGYLYLSKLADNPTETFVRRTPSTELWDEAVPHDKIKAMSEYLEDFKIVPKEDLPAGVQAGVSFTTLTINAPRHLQYLVERLKSQYGVRFLRQRLPSIHAGFNSLNTSIVFNCIGNAALSLPGVQDTKCYPTRGQVLLTRAPWVQSNIMRHGKNYETYVIPRPELNGNVILGGYMQKGCSDGSTYSYETDSILERTKELSQELGQRNPELLAVFAGLRPSREGGARVEREHLSIAGKDRIVVHNYGAGGTGFQAGYGMALDAAECVKDALQMVGKGGTYPRL